ncbi:MAG: serine/threonine protein kinase [Bryobacterales bacterium]|nr:serine/threonine protein kinase [Bryobacterales bacterium]
MPDEDVTRTTPRSHPSLTVTSAIDEGRFPPGTLLNQRYRIVSMIGKGGMGEVYRANDLILGQPVALKFLPPEMARDEQTLNRFRNEVRVARQVSHPNVCRVYDLGEADGHPYLSMEYVDGEDLSTLLKRIGHLSQDKGVELARQLCAGLAAAHDKGVLHRDLKPANLLLNSRGQLMITDFGLAGLAENVQADVRSGTPAYMAPEQLSGLEVTHRSDIYALGLVLYEMFSGKKAHSAETRAELQRLKDGGSAPSLSSLVKDLDPAIERVIERCLAPDPMRRPSSALAVSAALPGGDPLAAALAAGETPTPEMVAASGGSDGLRPRTALLIVFAIVAGWVGTAVLNGHLSLLDKIPFEQPTDALAQKSKEMIALLGYKEKPADVIFGFSRNTGYQEQLNKHFGGKAWEHLMHTRPSLVNFWYRSTPTSLWPANDRTIYPSEFDPPLTTPGAIRISLDPEGRLRSFIAIPKATDPQRAEPFEWAVLFRLAELDMAQFKPVEPESIPLVSFDRRGAWKGTISQHIPHEFRVEAATFRGVPVHFNVAVDWGETPTPPPANAADWGSRLSFLLYACAYVFSAWMAWKNWTAGRTDRVGAWRLAVLVSTGAFLTFLLAAHYNTFQNLNHALMNWLAVSVFVGVLFGTMYMAFEPHVRKRWPEMLVSWTRLFSGRFADPMVGRHVLYGVAGAMAIGILSGLTGLAEKNLRLDPQMMDLQSLTGVRFQFAALSSLFANTIGSVTYILFLLLGLRVLLRNQWLAMAVTAAILAGLGSMNSQLPWFNFSISFLLNGLLLVYLLRFGYLATVVVLMCFYFMGHFPPDLHWANWYASSNTLCLLFLAALTLYGFKVSTAGQKTLTGELD